MLLRKTESQRFLSLSVETAFVFLLLTISLFFNGCREKDDDLLEDSAEQQFIDIDKIQVPIFQSAAEQLNYSRSWFGGIQEKRAALEAFLSLYPMEKRLCGLAALDLAYLELGDDYRFAYKHDGFAAIKSYKEILDTYADFSEITTKSHWYLGWIYSEIIGDHAKGEEHYQLIVKQFPLEKITLPPPASWASIIYHNDEAIDHALTGKTTQYWAALALLEIIRNSAGDEAAWDAFSLLRRNYHDNIATGFALRFMLQRRFHVAEVIEIAKQYMEIEYSNVYILGDIQKEINEIAAAGGKTSQ